MLKNCVAFAHLIEQTATVTLELAHMRVVIVLFVGATRCHWLYIVNATETRSHS